MKKGGTKDGRTKNQLFRRIHKRRGVLLQGGNKENRKGLKQERELIFAVLGGITEGKKLGEKQASIAQIH